MGQMLLGRHLPLQLPLGTGTEHAQQLTPSTRSSTTGLSGDPLAAGQIADFFILFFFNGKKSARGEMQLKEATAGKRSGKWLRANKTETVQKE